MKTSALYVSLIFFGLTSFISGQEISVKDPRWKQLTQAYGYVVGQQAALEMIELKFPDLAQGVRLATLAFNSSALGEGLKGVESELSVQLGAKWPESRNQMSTQAQALIKEQEITHDQAVTFVAEVKSRAKGELPDAIRSTLLSANPRFSSSPALEIIEGWKQTFRTKGHPKARGADFSISIPASWSKREGNRPDIIQFFESGAGHGPIMCSLVVKDIPLPAGYKLTSEEKKEIFLPDALKDLVPDGGTFVNSQTLVLEGAPAGMLVFDQTMQRLELTFRMRMTQFVTIQGSSMIIIQFMIAEMPKSEKSLDTLQSMYLPTYRAIANTFVFNEKYE